MPLISNMKSMRYATKLVKLFVYRLKNYVYTSDEIHLLFLKYESEAYLYWEDRQEIS